MGATRFDRLVRLLAARPSRREVAGALSGLTLAGVAHPLLDDRAALAKKKKKVSLCHEGQTITVSRKAKKKHLKHGDTLGECPVLAPPAPPTSTTSTTTTTTPPPGTCAGGECTSCGTGEVTCLCAARASSPSLIACIAFPMGAECLTDEACEEDELCVLDCTHENARCMKRCTV